VHLLSVFVRIEIEVFLGALTAIVVFQVLTRKINTKGLLLEKTASGQAGFSPARLQMLLITLAGAFYLISQVVNNIHHATLKIPPQFPIVDSRLFLLLGGSHSIYLGAKLNSFFSLFGKSNSIANLPKGDQQ
jgi:hypothetical protein